MRVRNPVHFLAVNLQKKGTVAGAFVFLLDFAYQASVFAGLTALSNIVHHHACVFS